MKLFGFVLACSLLTTAVAGDAARLGIQDRGRTPAPAQPAAQAAKPDAQSATPPPPPPPPPPPAPTKNIQIEVTVNLEGGSTPMSKRMTLVTAENSVALGRAGIDIAVPNSSIGPPGTNTAPVVSYNYRSVGLNVDARPRLGEANRIILMLKLEFSAVLKPETGAAGMPAFGKSNTDLNLVLESGKPLTVTQSNDAEIGRGYSVELKATILR